MNANINKVLSALRSQLAEGSQGGDWGSSDQQAMNDFIHRALEKPKNPPTLGAVMDAAESAVEHYWGDWPEFRTDHRGLVMDAARKYYTRYFPDFMATMRKFIG